MPAYRTSRHLLLTHKVLLVIADIMFLLGSAHLGLLMYEVFTGSIPTSILQAAVTIAHFQVWVALSVAYCACLSSPFQYAFGDIVLIWRVWVVWNRDLRSIVLPVLILITSFGESPPIRSCH